MILNRSIVIRAALLISLMANLTILSSRIQADTGNCGGVTITLPFTDVAGSNIFFCSIGAAYFSGITAGTSATTYSPAANVTREQMAAFTSRTLEQSLKRSHTRAALGEWWTNKNTNARTLILTTGLNPQFLACDGQTVWASNTQSNTVSRTDISTNSHICTRTGIPSPEKIVIVSGRVFVTSFQAPGKIYTQSGDTTTDGSMIEFTAVGANPIGITYDGENLWTANFGTGPGSGSISRVNISTGNVTTFTTGFSQPRGILFDGVNLWVTDAGDTSLKRVDMTTGAVILPTIPLSGSVNHPVFDGTNLWIPCGALAQLMVPDKVFVVRAVGGLTGTILAQLTGNGLNGAFQAAFDGERICVTNSAAQSVSLWKASDLSPITSVNIGGSSLFNPRGICSDGTTFFIGIRDQSEGGGFIARF
jgi:hypothetical protein